METIPAVEAVHGSDRRTSVPVPVLVPDRAIVYKPVPLRATDQVGREARTAGEAQMILSDGILIWKISLAGRRLEAGAGVPMDEMEGSETDVVHANRTVADRIVRDRIKGA